ncbi:MAG: pentapeptide repeat-containing protein [Sphaerospermopsis kisseleviana]
MANKESIQKLQDLIQRVVEAETDDFSALVEIAGLDPLQDFAGADLSGADLRVADLSGANLSGANLSRANLSRANLSGATVENAIFGDNQGISPAMKRDLIERGAIFEDSPGDRSCVLTRV